MKAKATTIRRNTCATSLSALLALLVLLFAGGCSARVDSKESSKPSDRDVGLNQDAPPTGTAEIIKVDLNAIEPDPKNREAVELCQELRGPLLQVVGAEKPVQEAQALGLNVRKGQVQVMMILEGTDSAFLYQTGIEVDKQADEQVQAFVPIARLCELARHKRVLAIYPASQAETQ